MTGVKNADVRSVDTRLAVLLAKDQIREVLCRYNRGIDRKDFDLVRSHYTRTPPSTTATRTVVVEEFIAYAMLHEHDALPGDPDHRVRRVEGCGRDLSVRRPPAPARAKPKRDISIVLRYVGVFEERSGQWRILHRTCAHDRARIDTDRRSRADPGGRLPRRAGARRRGLRACHLVRSGRVSVCGVVVFRCLCRRRSTW